jgi:multidrug efflux pump subunit AcrA (membrane-fusion protein)
VETGAVLADLDTTSLEADRLQLEAEVALAQDRLAAVQEQMARDRERAEINVALARLDLDYARTQADEPPTPEQQYEIDRRALELQLAQLALNEVADMADPLLQADIDEAQLRLAEVEELLAQNALVAPFDGQLISFNVSEGQRVQAQNRVGIIADTTLLELHATLLESELQVLAEGMAATMTASDRPGAQFTGFIRRLPFPFGSLGENLEILEGDNSARIAFDDPAAANSFELGDRLRVNVLVERRENALWLPPAALRNFSGRDFVIVQDGAGQRRIDVVLGVEGAGRVEIVSGLEEGAVVVAP